MATYLPPTEDLPTFDTLVFSSLEDNITIANGDTRYLRFPVSQGSETISGNLTTTGAIITSAIQGTTVGTATSLYSETSRTGAINFGTGTSSKTITIGNDTATTTEIKGSTINATRLAVSGTLSAGTFAPATINCATLNSATGTNQTIGNNLTTNSISLGNAISSGTINIGNGLTSGTIDIGKGTGGTITIANASSTTASVQIGTDASAFNDSTCVIGQNSALSINNSNGNVNLSTASTSAGTLTIANEAGSNRTIQIGRNNAITVNNGATSTVSITGTTNINTGGTVTTQIGNNSASSIVSLFGTVNVNSSGSQSTAIGNSTGTTTILKTLAEPSATSSVSTQSGTTPYIGGTYFSAFSSGTTGVAPSTSYAPFATANAWDIYAGSSQWNTNGGITLPQGTYLCWMGLNIEGTADSITDMRMGILTRSTAPTATETDWTNSLPFLWLQLVGSPRNFSLYFHKTDSTDNSPNDSEQFNISGCVYVNGSTALYPWFRWNKLGTNPIIQGSVIFTRIGL